MILNKKALTLAEVKEYVPKSDEKRPIDEYLTKFGKLNKQKAHQLADDIRAINNPKIREEDVVKVVDFLPQDASDVNKIFNEVSLSEEEIAKILETVKKYI